MNSSIWERFTKRARQVFSYAQEEAKRLNHSYIGGEHLLIGLLREDGGVAGRVLRELGLETNRVRTVVERLTGGKSSGTPFSKIELAPSTKRVLEYALEQALADSEKTSRKEGMKQSLQNSQIEMCSSATGNSDRSI